MKYLDKQEIKNVIEGKGAASRPPILYDLWIGNNVFGENEETRQQWLSRYPMDVEDIFLNIPDLLHAPEDDPNYRWAGRTMEELGDVGIDARILIEDWEGEEAEEFYKTFPDPEYPGLIPIKKPSGERYTIARWWYGFFERLWSLRGMENALMDFFLYPDEVHRLFRKLTNFYLRIMERTCEEMKIDGFFISDDIGTQNSPFFSLEIFREFFKPYYKQLFDKAHELGTHFWLHTCGNIEMFLPEFIEIGLDVIHPIQKYTMEEKRIARQFGSEICLLVGFDVQQTIPFGTPEDVRKEIRYLLDTFQRKDGRLMMTMGNGSTVDWSLENLQALYEETFIYGSRELHSDNGVGII